jgi:hypothetical protein
MRLRPRGYDGWGEYLRLLFLVIGEKLGEVLDSDRIGRYALSTTVATGLILIAYAVSRTLL